MNEQKRWRDKRYKRNPLDFTVDFLELLEHKGDQGLPAWHAMRRLHLTKKQVIAIGQWAEVEGKAIGIHYYASRGDTSHWFHPSVREPKSHGYEFAQSRVTARLPALLVKGLGKREIARQLGVHYSSVKGAAKRLKERYSVEEE